MSAQLLTLNAIRLTFGGDPLFEDASMLIGAQARIAVVGRNGSGKSTLLKVAAGIIDADAGERFIDPKCALAYLPQEPDFTGFDTFGEYIDAGRPPTAHDGVSQRLIADLAINADADPANASGGEARRAAIARAFASEPDILLMDEPTNHLDIAAIDWLEKALKRTRAAVLLISHDRCLLEAVTTQTLWVDRGRTYQVDKGFADFETWRDAFLEKEAADAHKLDRKIAAEEDWVRYGVTARRKRNVRRMAELGALREKRRTARGLTGSVNFSVNIAQTSSSRVIKAKNLSKSFGDAAIVRDFSLEIVRGDRVAFVGANGAGKTTLLRLLTGSLVPDSGEVKIGDSLQIVTLDQQRASLDPSSRVADAITDGRGDWVDINGEKKHVAGYLKDFLFAPEQFRSPVSALSGGERGRLALAAALAKPSNLLLLDEPTNDLDMETLDLLEEVIADYPGTLLLVSHDRSFIDRIATSVVVPTPEAPGRWQEYVGGYSDMLRQRANAPANAKLPPTHQNEPPEKTTKPVRSGKAPRNKLTYKEKYALEKLPEKIDALQNKILTLNEKLANPKLFEADAATFNASAKELTDAEAALAAAEEEWLLLEIKREELDS